MKKVVIDDEVFVPQNEENSPVKIVILQRGWVFVGNYSEQGDYGILENAKCIGAWGTTRGLGEIALAGPTESTKLDPHGKVRFHALTTIALIDCENKKWQSKLI